MKKIILFDIDFTLFNTDKFRDVVYRKVAEKIGQNYNAGFITKTKEAEEITRHALGKYEPKFFLETIIGFFNSDNKVSDLQKEFEKKENFTEALYEDAQRALVNLSKIKDVTIGILSTGESEFQKKKIDIVKKTLHQDHVHIFVDKLEEIQNVIRKYKNYEVFLVDDLLAVLELGKRIRNDIHTIHMTREKSWEHPIPVKFKPDLELETLDELPEYVIKY